MKQIHQQEKKQFKKLFGQEQIDRFEDRFRILEVFLQSENHITVTGLVRLLEESGHPYEQDFVRDTLRLMCEFGFADKNRFDNGEVHYEHRHLGQHHDHMICTKCRQIYEFQDENLETLQLQIAGDHGFHMLQHRMEIYGICSECLRERIQRLPLVHAKPGERLVIKEFIGGANSRMRLLTMGLRIGDTLEVISNQSAGQVVVAIEFSRYALGRGLAQKILVEPESTIDETADAVSGRS